MLGAGGSLRLPAADVSSSAEASDAVGKGTSLISGFKSVTAANSGAGSKLIAGPRL